MKQYQGAGATQYEQRRQRQAKWQWENRVIGDTLARIGGEVASVIDAPVGTGRFLGLYCVPAIGYDVSNDMLNVAREKHATADLAQLDLLRDAIPARADLVVCVRFLNLVDTRAAAMALGKLLDAANKYALFTVRTGEPQRIGKVYVHRRAAIEDVIAGYGFNVFNGYIFPDKVGGDYNVLLCKRRAA
jgi:predicted TPR repeat methyltransferase